MNGGMEGQNTYLFQFSEGQQDSASAPPFPTQPMSLHFIDAFLLRSCLV